jgi:hypothetical protein
VLDALSGHGARPTATTRPELVHEFVCDLYRYEIRRLRDGMRQREFSKTEYAGRVIDLRLKYRVISMRPHQWMTTGGGC